MKTAVITARGKTICRAEVLATLASQAKGLMFANKAKPLLFVFSSQKRHCIHSFFCPVFDAIFIDGEKKAVALHSNIKPNQPTICSTSLYLLECPAGTVGKFKIKIGDKLTWKLEKS